MDCYLLVALVVELIIPESLYFCYILVAMGKII